MAIITDYNRNKEGRLVESLMNCIYSKYSNDLSKFKFQLAQYNRYFDGSCQRDAYQCLIFILTILNIGTKERLIIDDMSLCFMLVPVRYIVPAKLLKQTNSALFHCLNDCLATYINKHFSLSFVDI